MVFFYIRFIDVPVVLSENHLFDRDTGFLYDMKIMSASKKCLKL